MFAHGGQAPAGTATARRCPGRRRRGPALSGASRRAARARRRRRRDRPRRPRGCRGPRACPRRGLRVVPRHRRAEGRVVTQPDEPGTGPAPAQRDEQHAPGQPVAASTPVSSTQGCDPAVDLPLAGRAGRLHREVPGGDRRAPEDPAVARAGSPGRAGLARTTRLAQRVASRVECRSTHAPATPGTGRPVRATFEQQRPPDRPTQRTSSRKPASAASQVTDVLPAVVVQLAVAGARDEGRAAPQVGVLHQRHCRADPEVVAVVGRLVLGDQQPAHRAHRVQVRTRHEPLREDGPLAQLGHDAGPDGQPPEQVVGARGPPPLPSCHRRPRPRASSSAGPVTGGAGSGRTRTGCARRRAGCGSVEPQTRHGSPVRL